MALEEYTILGIIFLLVSLVLIDLAIFFLMKSTAYIRVGMELNAVIDEETGTDTVYNVTAVISAKGSGIADNPVLYLTAESVDETVNTVWDTQTLLLGKIKAGTTSTIETKITAPSGCDVRVKGTIVPKSANGHKDIYSVESNDFIVRSEIWNESISSV